MRRYTRVTEVSERRVALVSGASRGIGREVVRLLAVRGMTVVLGARDARAGDEAAAALRLQRLSVDGEGATMDMAVAELAWQTDALGAWRVAVAASR